MNEKEVLDLYRTALNRWGNEAQLNMFYEECGELLSAINKLKRGRVEKKDVITEIADVSIMIEQMAVLFGYNEFAEEKERKLTRLKEKLNGNNNK